MRLPLETKTLKALSYQLVEPKRFQPGVNLMGESTCTALPLDILRAPRLDVEVQVDI